MLRALRSVGWASETLVSSYDWLSTELLTAEGARDAFYFSTSPFPSFPLPHDQYDTLRIPKSTGPGPYAFGFQSDSMASGSQPFSTSFLEGRACRRTPIFPPLHQVRRILSAPSSTASKNRLPPSPPLPQRATLRNPPSLPPPPPTHQRCPRPKWTPSSPPLVLVPVPHPTRRLPYSPTFLRLSSRTTSTVSSIPSRTPFDYAAPSPSDFNARTNSTFALPHLDTVSLPPTSTAEQRDDLGIGMAEEASPVGANGRTMYRDLGF
jgi:hypothetical protein